jgi:Cu2+-exporting ATPase
MTCCANPAVYDYATEIAGRAQEQRIAELKASACIMEDGTAVYVVSVPDIHCGLCMAAIEDRLAKLDGVISSRVNLTLKRVTVVLDSRDRSPIDFRDAMEALGYKVLLLDSDSDHVTKLEFSNLVRALAVAGFASANIMLLSVSVWTGAAGATRELFHLISAMIAVPAIAYSGQPFFRSAVAALRGGRLNMDVPISLGVILALCMSLYEAFHGGRYAYFDAAVGLLFFLLIGRTLDQLMRAKSRLAVERLSKLSSRGAMRLGEDGKLVYVPIDEIVPAMVLRITAGERIPVDCVVLSGAGDVDRSLVTGESEPVSVMPGVSLEAGTLNLTDPIEIRVLRAASHSFLAEMLAMMNAAEHGRGVYDRIADRVARAYAPLVHVLAIASFLFWMYSTGGDWHTSLTIAIAVLIITCPCAIGLAVPVAHVISAERLFSAGILMKDGSALERLAKADYAVFDKTGTLTTGEPRLAASEIPQGSIGALAKALALRSSHPASKALARHLHDAVDVQLETVTEHPGQGMQARHNGKVLRLGRRAWVQEITKKAGKNSEFGLCFAIEDGSIYSVVLDEDLRPGAQEMLNSLLDARIACEMLTGDYALPVQLEPRR